MSWVVGGIFLLLWRLAGLLALPLLWVLPRSRPHITGLLAPEPGRTWLHGSSAGENVAASALASAMMPRPWRTHMTMRTPVQGTLPAPLDLPFVFTRWLDRARPSRLILIEAELWPGWIAACRRRGIPIAVVGSRESRGSRRWRWVPGLWDWLSRGIVFLPQSEFGDLKTRAAQPPAPFQLNRRAFIAASTRSGDEARILTAWQQLTRPPLLILAPRKMERVAEVSSLLTSHSMNFGLRSSDPDIGTLDVLLLDTMGELAGLLPQARAAFVGGSFDPSIGGHSPAEAFRAGLPVVAGPCRDSNPAAWQEGHAETVPVEDTGPRLASAIEATLERGPSTPPMPTGLDDLIQHLPDECTPSPSLERPWLLPLVPLWRLLSTRSKVSEGTGYPVVSVGGLTAGGSGKTPTIKWLAERLEGAWVVSRGYRRSPSGPAQRMGLPDQAPEHDLGDELEMLRRSGIPVISSPDRVAGATLARAQGARFILLDDSFQNRELARDLDIVCIDRRWPGGRGSIPVGTAREPWSSLERADWIWLHHDPPRGCPPPQLPNRPLLQSRIRPTGWRIKGHGAPLSAVQGAVDVVVGIARPEGFLCTLLDLGLELRSVTVLRDHGSIPPLPPGCVMTEKDAARLPTDSDIRALITELEVQGAEPLIAAIEALESP